MILSKKTIRKIDEFVYGITDGFVSGAKSDRGVDPEYLNAYAELLTSIGALTGASEDKPPVVGFQVPTQDEEYEDS